MTNLSDIFGGQVRGCKRPEECGSMPEELKPTNVPSQSFETSKADLDQMKINSLFGGHVKGLDKNEIGHMFKKSKKEGKKKMTNPFKNSGKTKPINAESIMGMGKTKGKKGNLNVDSYMSMKGTSKNNSMSAAVATLGISNGTKKPKFDAGKYMSMSGNSNNVQVNKMMGGLKTGAVGKQNRAFMHMVKAPEGIARKRMNQQPGLSMFGDFDGDKLANVLDCNPRNPNEQGFIHDWLNKKKDPQHKQETPQVLPRSREVAARTGQVLSQGMVGDIGRTVAKPVVATASTIKETGQVGGQVLSQGMVGDMGRDIKETGHFVGDKIGEAGGRIKSAGIKAGDYASDKLDATGAKLKSAGQSVQSAGSKAGHFVGGKIGEAGDYLGDKLFDQKIKVTTKPKQRLDDSGNPIEETKYTFTKNAAGETVLSGTMTGPAMTEPKTYNRTKKGLITKGEEKFVSGAKWTGGVIATGAKGIGKGIMATGSYIDRTLGDTQTGVKTTTEYVRDASGNVQMQNIQETVRDSKGNPILDADGRIQTVTKAVPLEKTTTSPEIHKGLVSQFGSAASGLVQEGKTLMSDVGMAQDNRRQIASDVREQEYREKLEQDKDIRLEQRRANKLGFGQMMGYGQQYQMQPSVGQYGGLANINQMQAGFSAATQPPTDKFSQLIGMNNSGSSYGTVANVYDAVRMTPPGYIEQPYGMKVAETIGPGVSGMGASAEVMSMGQPMAQPQMEIPQRSSGNGVMVIEGVEYQRQPNNKWLNMKTGKEVTYPRGSYTKKAPSKATVQQMPQQMPIIQ